jgi:hypothetical protein
MIASLTALSNGNSRSLGAKHARGWRHARKRSSYGARENPRTTKLYDRQNDQVMLDEIERICDPKGQLK